jgi:mevalonate kinase
MHYKPSGAGGGDFGIAFSSLKAPADEMIRRVAAEGFEVVKLETELEGVRRVGF